MIDGAITISLALAEAMDVTKDALELFTKPPAIYFVALALLSAGAGVARKFVPMKRK